MSISHSAAELGHTIVSQWPVIRSLRNCWLAFQEWRQRERLEDELCNLSDRALLDIGMTRGEIEYVVSNRSFDREKSGLSVR